jgi:hypothetical protein
VSPYPQAGDWLFLSLAAPLAPATKYKLVLTLSPAGASPPKAQDIDTTSSFTVTPSVSSAHPNQYDFTSSVLVFQLPGSTCDLKVLDPLGSAHPAAVQACYIPISDRMRQSPSPATAIQNPEEIGFVKVTLAKPLASQVLPLNLGGITDIFGKAPKIDAKSRLSVTKAPASKDASTYYLNFSNLAATGAKPSWALDGRVSPALGRLYHGFQFSPLAAASIGVGQISGQSYTDTIDFGLTANRIFEPGPVLQGLQLTPGVTFETDREIDRDNLLGTIDLRFNFAYSYNTRLRQQEDLWRQALQREKDKAGQPGNSEPPIAWTLDDIKPPLFGYAYDIHALVEAGGALTDTTIHATKGTATLKLPSYNIARTGAKLHSLFEVGRTSLDTTFTGRYLTASENSVFQTPANTLYLKTFSGWKAYMSMVGSVAIDAQGHFAISVTYQDGFTPPKFNRSNCILSGIVIKY